MPVRLGDVAPRGVAPRAFLLAYCADFDADPYIEMFSYPVDHPLGLSGYRLERLDARTGETTGQWPWPAHGPRRTLSHIFRNFVVGGQVNGAPVLVTAQGTHGDMFLQGWNPGMSSRWEHTVAESDPGARGSHMCPVVDLNNDGVDELLWGERCIELDAGQELFCADRETYRGHSDIVQPVLDRATGRWSFYTCRESDPLAAPRVAFYDDCGRRIWGAVDGGHIDMGWVARLGDAGELVASAVRIGHKICGPDGRYHTGMTEFILDALTGELLREGEPEALDWSTYGTIPVDLDGNGCHELVRGRASRNGEVLDRHGAVLGTVGAPVAMACKFLDRPGEQLLAYYPDGTVRAWGDRNAQDTPQALARYSHPFYESSQRLFGVGYNLTVLGGV